MSSGFELVVSGGTKPVGKDAVEWAKRCEESGRWRYPSHEYGWRWDTNGV